MEEMSNEEWEATYDPIRDLEVRWGIPPEDAELFLEQVGYFNTERYREVAEVFDPTEPSN